MGKDAEQQNYGRDARGTERKRERERATERDTAGEWWEPERKDPLYNLRNTGCSTRHIHTKGENEGRRAALDYRIN